LKMPRLRSWQQFERRGSGVAWPNQWLRSDPIQSIWKKVIKHRHKYLGARWDKLVCFIYFIGRKKWKYCLKTYYYLVSVYQIVFWISTKKYLYISTLGPIFFLLFL
jgi:hypothetical protein